MIKSILSCTDGSPHGENSIRYGIHLAHRLSAGITALHVLDSRMLEGPMMASISGWIGAQPSGDPLNQFKTIMQEKGEAILDVFKDLCKKEGLHGTAETHLKWGHPARVILEQGISAELVILGQSGEHDELTGEWTGSTVDRVIRESSKPCLIVPAEFAPVERILVAYDGSAHASRALHEAIELAIGLAAPLFICTVVEHNDHNRAMNHADTAMRLARAHECAAAHLIVEGDEADVLIQKAKELKCGMLVAGAHGHTRIRNMIIGSTANKLLNNAKLPLMLVR